MSLFVYLLVCHLLKIAVCTTASGDSQASSPLPVSETASASAPVPHGVENGGLASTFSDLTSKLQALKTQADQLKSNMYTIETARATDKALHYEKDQLLAAQAQDLGKMKQELKYLEEARASDKALHEQQLKSKDAELKEKEDYSSKLENLITLKDYQLSYVQTECTARIKYLEKARVSDKELYENVLRSLEEARATDKARYERELKRREAEWSTILKYLEKVIAGDKELYETELKRRETEWTNWFSYLEKSREEDKARYERELLRQKEEFESKERETKAKLEHFTRELDNLTGLLQLLASQQQNLESQITAHSAHPPPVLVGEHGEVVEGTLPEGGEAALEAGHVAVAEASVPDVVVESGEAAVAESHVVAESGEVAASPSAVLVGEHGELVEGTLPAEGGEAAEGPVAVEGGEGSLPGYTS